MASSIKYLISRDVWDALPDSYWDDYNGIPPCMITELNGYVLCSLMKVENDDKAQIIGSIEGAQEFEHESMIEFRLANPEIWEVDEE